MVTAIGYGKGAIIGSKVAGGAATAVGIGATLAGRPDIAEKADATVKASRAVRSTGRSSLAAGRGNKEKALNQLEKAVNQTGRAVDNFA